MSRIPDQIKNKKSPYFSELWPFENLGILKKNENEIFSANISKSI